MLEIEANKRQRLYTSGVKLCNSEVDGLLISSLKLLAKFMRYENDCSWNVFVSLSARESECSECIYTLNDGVTWK